MPRPAHPCPSAECRAIVPSGGGSHCVECTSAARRRSRDRNDRADGHYASREWYRRRDEKLQESPFCECGCGRPSEVVDHNPPRRQLIAAGVQDPDHRRWLVALAKRCHNSKTASLDGGFGRDAASRGLEPMTVDDDDEPFVGSVRVG